MNKWIQYCRNFIAVIIGFLLCFGAASQTHVQAAVQQVPAQAGKIVYLTFDDGPNPDYTPRILDILRRKQVHATFFILGSRATQYPELVRRTYREGNEIGNHGYYHTFIVHKSKGWVERDINETDRVIQTLCGEKPRYFRPPGGILSKSDLGLVIGTGHAIAMWTLDTNDWKGIPASQVVDSVLKDVRSNSIVLMHDGVTTSSNTVQALPIVIDALRARGYVFDVLPKHFQGTSIGGATDSKNYRFKQNQ